MKKGMHYGSGSSAKKYGNSSAKSYSSKGKNPLKGRKMPRGPKDPAPSHKGYAN